MVELLEDLANVLVVGGFGVVALNKLAKRAFIEAALKLERKTGRRQNKARIAAITGLTRSEVSELTKTKQRLAEMPPSNRAHRVSLGWISDPRFCRQGKPRILGFTYGNASFEKLVKLYSGDIPARAMLTEMARLGMVREEPGRKVRLLRTKSPVRRHTIATLEAISPWVRFFSDGDIGESQNLDANTVCVTLMFESLPQLYSAVREIQQRTSALVESVDQLGTNPKSARTYKLQVSIGLGTRIFKNKHLDERSFAACGEQNKNEIG